MLLMKSYGGLMDKVLTEDNVAIAIYNASNGKRDWPDVQKKLNAPWMWFRYYMDLATNYPQIYHEPVVIHDGVSQKQREIIVPSYDEQVLHHMAINIFPPSVMPGM